MLLREECNPGTEVGWSLAGPTCCIEVRSRPRHMGLGLQIPLPLILPSSNLTQGFSSLGPDTSGGCLQSWAVGSAAQVKVASSLSGRRFPGKTEGNTLGDLSGHQGRWETERCGGRGLLELSNLRLPVCRPAVCPRPAGTRWPRGDALATQLRPAWPCRPALGVITRAPPPSRLPPPAGHNSGNPAQALPPGHNTPRLT